MQDDKQWQKVDMVYHATNETTLSRAEKSDILTFENLDGTSSAHPVSLFSCKLWHDRNGEVVETKHTEDGRPTISPYANNHVIIPFVDVLESQDDYLLPIAPYHNPDEDPDESYNAPSGRTTIEMLYLRHQDVHDILGGHELTQADIEVWQLKNHPFVRRDSRGLHYRVIHNVWWVMLTPYEVPISAAAIWELNMGGERCAKFPRKIWNLVTLKLARNLGGTVFG